MNVYLPDMNAYTQNPNQQSSKLDLVRYPSLYRKIDSTSPPRYAMMESNNKLTESDKIEYALIAKHREEIINTLHNYTNDDNFTKLIISIINPESLTDNTLSALYDALTDSGKKSMLVRKLIDYCYYCQDTELFDVIILKSTQLDKMPFLFLPFGASAFNYENQKLFRVFMKHMNQDNNSRDINVLINEIIMYDNNIVIYLSIIAEYGYRMNDTHVSRLIVQNKIDAVQYAIDNNYNIQGIIDKILYIQDVRNGNFYCNVPMLKFLIDNKINLSNNANNILWNCIQLGNLDSVMFLVETFSESTISKHDAFDVACRCDQIDIMIYLLKTGLDINSVDLSTFSIKFETFKFLIESNYSHTQLALNTHLLKCFINDEHLDNVNYLIKHGSKIEWMIQKENQYDINQNYHKIKLISFDIDNVLELVPSPLELIITADRINHLKLLIDNYFSLVKPHLSRLFVMACANAKSLLAEYLLDYGAELNHKALETACFFGHLEIVIMLLKRGLAFDQYEKLFNLTICGRVCMVESFSAVSEQSKVAAYSLYKELITPNMDTSINDEIFRNDLYQYGNYSIGILKLLISHDTKKLYRYNLDLGLLTDRFYDIEIFRYLIENNTLIDINKKFIPRDIVLNGIEEITLLECSVIYNKLDIIEFLLQNGAKGPIINDRAVKKAKINQPIIDMLMKYGIIIDIDDL